MKADLKFLLLFPISQAWAVDAPNMASATDCERNPKFIKTARMQQPIAIDTQQSRLPGVVVRELKGARRIYRHPSWEQSGHVATSVRDGQGNIYTVPIPSISLDINPLEKRNNVYRIDSESGEMSVFVALPLEEEGAQENPFGTMGIFLDCDSSSLYVSSIAGSSHQNTNGTVYKIDIETQKVESSWSGVDAIGIATFEIDGQKRFYYGDARSSSVYSIPLLDNGDFPISPERKHEFSLLTVKNGDSTQVRKIRFMKDKRVGFKLVVTDTEFSYRLLANTGRRFRHYEFVWNGITAHWDFLSVR